LRGSISHNEKVIFIHNGFKEMGYPCEIERHFEAPNRFYISIDVILYTFNGAKISIEIEECSNKGYLRYAEKIIHIQSLKFFDKIIMIFPNVKRAQNAKHFLNCFENTEVAFLSWNKETILKEILGSNL